MICKSSFTTRYLSYLQVIICKSSFTTYHSQPSFTTRYLQLVIRNSLFRTTFHRNSHLQLIIHKSSLVTHHSNRLVIHYLLFTTCYSLLLFITRHSQLVIHNLLFATCHLEVVIHNSSFTNCHSQLIICYSL